MARKILLLLFPVTIAVLIAVQWQDLVRYFKIEQMDFGGGHPEVVPADGEHGYPDRGGVPDGTGDFDSASRGGPARAAEPKPRPAALP